MATAGMIEQAVQSAEWKARQAGAESHAPGWPHYDSKGNCLCQGKCCIGPGGCKCRGCSHASHT
jgi:hypothetical protein